MSEHEASRRALILRLAEVLRGMDPEDVLFSAAFVLAASRKGMQAAVGVEKTLAVETVGALAGEAALRAFTDVQSMRGELT